MQKFLLALAVMGMSTGAVQAATLGSNVVVNGDAETGDATGWAVNTGVFATSALAPETPFGTHSFTAGTGASIDVMQQTIDLTDHAALIDGGNLGYDLFAQLQNRTLGSALDQVFLVVEFRGAGNALLQSEVLTDSSVVNGVFDWNEASSDGTVAAGTRSVDVSLRFQRNGGSSTDAYADDVSLTFADISIAAVPLPAGLPLLLAGMGGLVLLRRRR